MKISKSNALGIAGIAISLGLVAYSAYKAHKDKKQVEETIANEHVDEKMIEAIETVSDSDFCDSELEREACVSVLEGYRKKVLASPNINVYNKNYLRFRTALKEIKKGGHPRYEVIKSYLNDLNKSNKDEKVNDVGDLVETVLQVTKTGVEMLK